VDVSDRMSQHIRTILNRQNGLERAGLTRERSDPILPARTVRIALGGRTAAAVLTAKAAVCATLLPAGYIGGYDCEFPDAGEPIGGGIGG
jgi:hypothetical protein